MTDLVVAKFGTSVADFDAMNRSIDVALLDANTHVVLSASAGVTNILVALAGAGTHRTFFPAGRSASDPVQYSGAFALSQRDPRRD